MIRDFEDCCRLCLSKDQMQIPIFSPDELEKMIAPKILYCYSLFVFPQDPFSKQLCLRCFCRLEESWSFQQECFRNNSILIKSLLDETAVKGSEQYLKSVNNAMKTTTVHSLLSCRTVEQISQVHRNYESLIDFSCRVEKVELIDICSDEEDSKESVQAQIQRNSRLLTNSNLQQTLVEHSSSEPVSSVSAPDSTTRSSRRSVSSDVSDDACSSYSERTTSSHYTDNRNEDSNLRQSRERTFGIDLNSNAEDSDKTRRTRSSHKDEAPARNRSELRSLRPLMNKKSESSSRTTSPDTRSRKPGPKSRCRRPSPPNKSLRTSSGRLSRSSATIDNDANSFGSRDSLNTIDSDISTNSKKKRKRSRSPSVPLEKPQEPVNKKRKLNGQLSGHKVDAASSGPSAKKPKSSETAEVSNVAVSSSVGDSSIKMYSCKYCNQTFKLKINRKQHLKKCSEKKIINCKYCLKRMYREEDLWQHNICHVKINITRLPKNRHKCLKCDRYFYPKSALRKHKNNCKVPDENDSSSEEAEVEVSKAGTSSGSKNDKSPILENPNGWNFRTKRTTVNSSLENIKVLKEQPKSHGLNMETSAEYVNTYCKYCHDHFSNSTELWKHMLIGHKFVNVHASKSDTQCRRSVDNITTYRCTDDSCKKKFATLKELILHSGTHTLLKCRFCDFTTHKFYMMQNHPVDCSFNPDKTRAVTCCDIKFRKNYNFYVHKMIECYSKKEPVDSSVETTSSVITDETEKCGVCSKNIAAEELLTHLINHSRSKFIADLPGTNATEVDSKQAMFMKIFDLCPREWSKENNEDSYKCAECKDSFPTRQTLYDHQETCFILSCTKCKLNFCNNFDFVMHKCVDRCQWCLTPQDDKRHLCVARKLFSYTTVGKKLKCDICSCTFPNVITSRKHLLRHFPLSTIWQENIKCGICNEKFTNELTLNIHYYLKHRSSNKPQEQATAHKQNPGELLESTKVSKNTRIILGHVENMKDTSTSSRESNQQASSDDKIDCHKTPVKQKSAAENQSPNGVKILSSPRYKIGNQDYSWKTSCPPTPPALTDSSELSSILS